MVRTVTVAAIGTVGDMLRTGADSCGHFLLSNVIYLKHVTVYL